MDLTTIKPNVIDPTIRGKNFLFYGPPGTRKTSIAACFPRPIFGQTEDGTKFISGVHGVRLKTWNDVKQFVRELRRPEVQEIYDTVVLDRADIIYGYCYDYILQQLSISDPSQAGYGTAWKKIEREFTSTMNRIEAEGYGMIFISHDKDVLNQKMEYIGTKVKLDGQAASVIRGMTDFIFNLRKENVNGYQTVIAYSDSIEVETKSRSRYFTDKFEFTYENLEKELKIAIDKQVKIDGIHVEAQKRVTLEDRKFDTIRDSVIAMVTKLTQEESPYMDEILQLLRTQLQGRRISEVNENFYVPMLTIETYLLGVIE